MQCEEHKWLGKLMISPAEPGSGTTHVRSLRSVGHPQTSPLLTKCNSQRIRGPASTSWLHGSAAEVACRANQQRQDHGTSCRITVQLPDNNRAAHSVPPSQTTTYIISRSLTARRGQLLRAVHARRLGTLLLRRREVAVAAASTATAIKWHAGPSTAASMSGPSRTGQLARWPVRQRRSRQA
jgi:hypothetical protein